MPLIGGGRQEYDNGLYSSEIYENNYKIIVSRLREKNTFSSQRRHYDSSS